METLDILVVDDKAGMRKGAKRILDGFTVEVKDVGAEVTFNVSTVETGEKAIELISKTPPHILLLDHKLPGLSGIQVMEQVDGVSPDMLIIMITSYDALDTSIRATRLGAYDFLPKPFTPAELKSVVKKAAKHIIITLEAKKLAEEKNQVRFQFISVLAHELKSPINAVEGYLKLMQDKSNIEDPEAFDHMVDRSLTRIGFMRKLIIDLLDMTRIESGKKQREISDVDIVDTARISIESVLPGADERGITIHLETPEPVYLQADRDEIEIITNNLISNAVKYNRDNGEVFVRVTREGETITITVRDTGIGMSREKTEKLFNDFVRIKNAKTRNILGSGLGLSIVKKIAQVYGGSASVESIPDEGSTFTVTLTPTITE